MASRYWFPLASRPANTPRHAAPPAAVPNPVSLHGLMLGAADGRHHTPPPLLEPYALLTPTYTVESVGSNEAQWDSWLGPVSPRVPLVTLVSAPGSPTSMVR